jgi:peptide/nickel transport system permease protein
MTVRRFLAERSAFFVLSFVILLLLNFAIPRLMPGNPIDRFVNPEMTIADQKAILATFGLTQPLYVQFLLYAEGVFSGNFGVSFLYYPIPVATILEQRLPWTVFLVGMATIFSVLIGLFLGMRAASRAGTKEDSTYVLGSMAFRSIPTFWLGLILLITFGVIFRIFPTSGYFSTQTTISGASTLGFASDVLYHSFLPIVTLMAYLVGGNLLIMRASALGTLQEDFVLTLNAIGYPKRKIVYNHVLKNAFLPMLTNIGIQMGFIVSGAVLVETVFSYPGMGLLVYQAVLARDYPTLQGAFFILTLAVLVAVFATDLFYSFLDPRIRR